MIIEIIWESAAVSQPTRAVEWGQPGPERRLTQIHSKQGWTGINTVFRRSQYSKGLVLRLRQDQSFHSPNIWINRGKHADTLGAAPPQWVFYASNFLILFQLATYPCSYQVGICIMHTHTATIPTITFISLAGTFLFHLLLQTHAHSARKTHTCVETFKHTHKPTEATLNCFKSLSI